jgi:BirA family transcriptional regulator, biotin operon repressor / biotin---[acetyl-CoA-carboxylase] ligase
MTGYLQVDVMKAAIAETHNVDMDVIVHESIDSTNSWSIQECKRGKALPFACFAENQTSGKGRRGKQWLMSAYSNIAMSISWPYILPRQQLHLLPLSVALAVVKTLEEFGLQQVQIKWPNDVYVQGKKIAGILIETQPTRKKLHEGDVAVNRSIDESQTAVVIGVGLNYDMSSFVSAVKSNVAEILSGMTDITREMAGQKIDRGLMALILLQKVVGVCKDFQQNSKQNLDEFRMRYDYCKNNRVEILLDNQEILSGIARGVNDVAELLVMVDGEERAFNSAEVSVKPDTQ